MSSQPPYGYPGSQGGGYPPPPPPPANKTKVLNLEFNTAALLCYIPTCCCFLNVIAGLLFFFTEPRENRLLRFHALQGMFLAGVWFVIWVILTILGVAMGISSSMMPGGDMARAGGGLLFLMLRLVVGVAFLAVHIMGMVKANQGQMWKLPIIGDIAEKNA
jgi:uncharacterized membrane protein